MLQACETDVTFVLKLILQTQGEYVVFPVLFISLSEIALFIEVELVIGLHADMLVETVQSADAECALGEVGLGGQAVFNADLIPFQLGVGIINVCLLYTSHNDNFTFYFVTHFQVRIQSIPRMRSQLLQAESDTLLFIIEVKDNHVDLLIQLNDFFRMRNAAPRQVCDMDQTVYATQVDEYAVGSDILDCSFPVSYTHLDVYKRQL